MRLSNGGAITYAVEQHEARLWARSYRVIGSRGPVVDLERVPDEPREGGPKPEPAFARRARFVTISDGVGLFTGGDSSPSLAFRASPAPAGVLGRYELAKSREDLAAIDVGAHAVEISRIGKDIPSVLPILAGSEHAGAAASLIFVGGSSNQEVSVFDAPNGTSLVEMASARGVVASPVVRFEPVSTSTRPKAAPDSPAALPSAGSYVVDGLGSMPSLRVQIEGARWTIAVAGHADQLAGTATLAGYVGKRRLHVHLDLGPSRGVLHLDLRPLSDQGGKDGAFLVSGFGGIRGYVTRAMGLAFRADAIPSWAPSFGFDKDIDLLCRELGGLPEHPEDDVIQAAFEHVGRQATSDRMRGFCSSAFAVDRSMRYTMIKYAFQGVGIAMPTCGGMEKLRRISATKDHREEKP